MNTLDHERLDVYKAARELSREVGRLIAKARNKQVNAALVDQIRRAVASVLLNIAEGSGEESPGRKAYFYRIARGSATEVAAALDYMVDMNMLAEADATEAKKLIVRIVSMLYKLTRATTPESFPPLPGRPQNPR